MDVFLQFSSEKLAQLTERIESCLDKLSEEQLWARNSGNENAVGNLVLHLCGNVRQWIGEGVGGHPNIRDRDAEFAARGGIELRHRLAETIAEGRQILEQIDSHRLTEKVTIQSYTVTILEAIYHVVEHFSQHTGQIIFATKLLTGEDLGFYRHLSKPAHAEKVP